MVTAPARRHLTLLTAMVAIACASCAPPPTPAQQAVEDIFRALGGRARIQAVRTLTLSGDGRQFNLGQDLTPDASGQTFNVSSYIKHVSLAPRRSRTELTRTPAFAYFQGPAPQRQVQALDGDVAFNVSATGTVSRASAPVAHDRRAEFLHHPLTIAHALLDSATAAGNVRTSGNERLLDLTVGDLALVVAIDAGGVLVRAESRGAHPNLGDVVHTTLFEEYQGVAGLELPTRLRTKVDDFVTADIRVTVTLDGEVPDLAAPPAVASAATPAPAAPNVVPQELSRGVWLLAGQSHHSALIELSDGLLLVDAPQSETRTLAVMSAARALRPDKPLNRLVMTHHHFDHTAGLRAAIAAGLTVITHDGNRAFVEAMAKRPHTLQPDRLAAAPREAQIETIGADRVLADALRTVGLHHVADSPHSSTMLMVHLPAERLLVQVDAFSPGAAVNPYAANLLDNIVRRKLAVDRIVPLHGAVTPYSALLGVGRM